MKRSTFFSLLLFFALIACIPFINDGLTFLIASLMGIMVWIVFRTNRKRVIKVTRWAKSKPQQAQVFIAIVQITLMSLGLILGYNLKQLGYELSDATSYIFTGIMVYGFLQIPFLPKRKTIAIPAMVKRHRLAYLGIALSTFVLMTFTGNRIGEAYPNSPITHTLEKIDQFIFQDDVNLPIGYNQVPQDLFNGRDDYNDNLITSTPKPLFVVVDIRDKEKAGKSTNPNLVKPESDIKEHTKARKKAERKSKRQMKKMLKKERRKFRRAAAASGMCALGVLLIILLLAPLCAGICFIIGAWGVTGAGAILGGILLTAASVFGMVKAAKLCAKSKD